MKADAAGIGFHFFWKSDDWQFFIIIWLESHAMIRLYNTLHVFIEMNMEELT